MIKTLHISNYALIDNLDIEFDPGFNIITGETGAGKSIIMGALNLLSGGRADIKSVLRDQSKSVIEATFSYSADSDIPALLSQNDIDSDAGGECILRRELMSGGRSRAFINDTPVTLQILRQVAMSLIDIHSQNQNLQLASEDYQRHTLDLLAANGELLRQYADSYRTFRHALKEYSDTRDMLRLSRDNADFIAYRYEQLNALQLQPGEKAALEAERRELADIVKIQQSVEQALQPLAGAAVNGLGLLSDAHNALRRLSDDDDERRAYNDSGNVACDSYRAMADRLESAIADVRDIADTLSMQTEKLPADPGRLQQVEERLSTLYSLELRNGVGDTDALIELRDNLKSQLDTLADADNILSALERRAKLAKRDALALATQLSERRRRAADTFAGELAARAMPLGLPNLQCRIDMTRDKLGPDGMDRIAFLFAFNKNQTPAAAGNGASGGEMSRLMLTIKAIVAEHTNMPTIIFDEVDTGVSGDIATRMGIMMASMARHLQVISITHLPGIAAMGSRHFKVYKQDDTDRTVTHIRTLDEPGRIAELALMLSGSADDTAAIANASAMLLKARKA